MTADGKLSISILSRNKQRGMKILDAITILAIQNGINEYIRGSYTLYTDDAVYQIINPQKHRCHKIDQLIVDYMCCNPDICDNLLHDSCVPYDFQIIDDTDILVD